jgi:ABC-type glycerol-3-phosphate transport system permease component
MDLDNLIPLQWSLRGRQTVSINAAEHLTEKKAISRIFNLSLDIHRRVSTKFFSVFVIIIMWVECLVPMCVTILIIWKRKNVHPSGKWSTLVLPKKIPNYIINLKYTVLTMNASLLFALPALKNAQPQVPSFGTLADSLGYFWNVSIVSTSFTVLAGYMISKNWVDGRSRRNREIREQIEEQLKQRNSKINFKEQVLSPLT